jgi:hypothetical protein
MAGEQLSPRQRRAIEALLSGSSKAEAAERAGVRPNAMSKWLRCPAFVEALTQAQESALAAVSAELSGGTSEAMAVLRGIMKDPAMPPTVRARAALGWLDHMWRGSEIAVLAARLADLERRLPADASDVTE